MFARSWLARLLLAAVVCAGAAGVGCQSPKPVPVGKAAVLQARPDGAKKSCGDPDCDTKH